MKCEKKPWNETKDEWRQQRKCEGGYENWWKVRYDKTWNVTDMIIKMKWAKAEIGLRWDVTKMKFHQDIMWSWWNFIKMKPSWLKKYKH